MNGLVGLVMLLMALLVLWAFSALFISAFTGMIVSSLLWQPLRRWRLKQLRRELEMNPALNLEPQAPTPSALFYLLSAAVVLLGCAAMLATLIHLPEALYSPEQLSLVCGLAFAISLATLIKLSGNLASLGKDAAADIRAAWSLAAGIVPMLSLVALIFFAPHTAGWMVWRERWRGYDSTQLRIPLKHNDAEHQQALLQLVRPLLAQGSRILSHRASSRSGGSYTLSAALPARYRFHEGALELQLAGLMPQEQLDMHLQALVSVVETAEPDSLQLAYAQCLPSPEWLGRQRFFGRGQQAMQSLRDCVRSRQSVLAASMPLLQGNLLEVQVGWTHFRPWPALPRWQAAALPEDEDELQQLDSLR